MKLIHTLKLLGASAAFAVLAGCGPNPDIAKQACRHFYPQQQPEKQPAPCQR